MIGLIDGDIIRYEIGFAATAGFRKGIKSDEEPPWVYVEEVLLHRLQQIKDEAGFDESIIYLTEGLTFREQIATKKDYKGHRVANKPWHFANLTAYITDVLGATIVRGIEADDAMAMAQTADYERYEHIGDDNAYDGGWVPAEPNTIICSRDKDLKQVPGWLYSWELGGQAKFGPELIDHKGYLDMKRKTDKNGSVKHKLEGTGMSFFYAQCLMGDSADNIPGLPQCGPVMAYESLRGCKDTAQMLKVVSNMYKDVYGKKWEDELTEQGQLLWMVRRFNPNGSPQVWQIGMED